MSFQASTWAAKQDVESSSAKFILLLLANYADADGFTFVGQKTLAEDASMSRRTVVRHMGVLERAGLIVRTKRFREDGSRSSDGTYLRLDVETDQPSANLTSGQKEQGPSDKNDIHQVPNCHSNNLSEEQSVNSQLDGPQTETKKTRRGSRISQDWILPDKDQAWALGQGLPIAAVMREAEQFHDHWLQDSSTKGAKLDWSAAWRTWIRNHIKWTKERTNGRSSGSKPNAIDNHLEGIEAALRARSG